MNSERSICPSEMLVMALFMLLQFAKWENPVMSFF
jgi:hypothetical protein